MEKKQEINEITNYIEIYFSSYTFEDSSDMISSLVEFEKEFIEKIKIKYLNSSGIKIVKQKFLEKLDLFFIHNKNYKNIYG